MLNQMEMTTLSFYGNKRQTREEACRHAGNLFNIAYGKAMRRSLWAKLTGKGNDLLSLDGRVPVNQGGRSFGVVTVPIEQIVGSEGRSQDFDADFNPRQLHNRERWMDIVVARRTGVTLPPVELVQVAGQYFVRDGHHRISVARTMGQLDIEARIVN
jgi:hypothetical protein